MKLGTLENGTRDGYLVLVNRAGNRWVSASDVAPTLQQALDDWDQCEPRLRRLADQLERNPRGADAVVPERFTAPLPRAYEWIDGSAYLHHMTLVRRARGADLPPKLESDPLVYQGGSGVLLGPRDPFLLPDPNWGLDLEAEVCVILGDVPRGIRPEHAEGVIRLLLLCNDWSYRQLIPAEVAKGFGFFNSKPATSFSPLAVTPDELGPAWRDGRLHLPIQCHVNGKKLGAPHAGEGMHFSFHDLIAHIARTRDFTAGTILGGGTVSNAAESAGVACLAEKRSREMLALGSPQTPFLRPGDSIRIEMLNEQGQSVFGAIEQEVRSA